MRQQDLSFAEMLNRLRVRKKNECLASTDIVMLKKCETGRIVVIFTYLLQMQKLINTTLEDFMSVAQSQSQ